MAQIEPAVHRRVLEYLERSNLGQAAPLLREADRRAIRASVDGARERLARAAARSSATPQLDRAVIAMFGLVEPATDPDRGAHIDPPHIDIPEPPTGGRPIMDEMEGPRGVGFVGEAPPEHHDVEGPGWDPSWERASELLRQAGADDGPAATALAEASRDATDEQLQAAVDEIAAGVAVTAVAAAVVDPEDLVGVEGAANILFGEWTLEDALRHGIRFPRTFTNQIVEDSLRNRDRVPHTGGNGLEYSIVGAFCMLFSDALEEKGMVAIDPAAPPSDEWADATTIMDEMEGPRGVGFVGEAPPERHEEPEPTPPAAQPTRWNGFLRQNWLGAAAALVILIALAALVGLLWLWSDDSGPSDALAVATDEPEDLVDAPIEDGDDGADPSAPVEAPDRTTDAEPQDETPVEGSDAGESAEPGNPPVDAVASPDGEPAEPVETTTSPSVAPPPPTEGPPAEEPPSGVTASRFVMTTVTVEHAESPPTVCDLRFVVEHRDGMIDHEIYTSCSGSLPIRSSHLTMNRTPGGTPEPLIDEEFASPTRTDVRSVAFDTSGGVESYAHFSGLFGTADQLTSVSSSNPEFHCTLRNAPEGTGGTHAYDCEISFLLGP